MHMSDALISVPVGATFIATTAFSIMKSSFDVRKSDNDKQLPLIGIMAALVFAMQMVNFTIPGTGSSGHFAGGYLLVLILGPQLAFLAISAVLIVQAIFFADGGILALGCNIFNLGFIPAFVIYPLLKRISGDRMRNFYIWLGASLSLLLGAIMVSIQTALSGIAELPFSKLFSLMVFIHLLISIVEGIITVSVYRFVTNFLQEKRTDKTKLSFYLPLAVFTLIVASVLSLIASGNPDGLEWSIYKIMGGEKEPESLIGYTHKLFEHIQSSIALLPDYNFKNSESILGVSFSGILGAILTFIFAIILGLTTKIKVK